MRSVTMLLLGVLMLGLAPAAQAKLPATVDEFKARLEAEGTDPVKAAHLYFEALYVYLNEDEATKARGREMMALINVNEGWEQELLGRGTVQKQPYLYRSYAKGATPANNYQMDPDNFELEFTNVQPQQEGKVTFFQLKCGGADTPRPFRMRRNKAGLWRMQECSSIQVGVKKTADEED